MSATTMIAVDLPDGSIISFDRVRRSFFVTMANGSIMNLGAIPARPNPPSVFRVQHADGRVEEMVKEEIKATPVTASAWVEKLGYKKTPIIHSDSWTRRHIRLDANSVGYFENESTNSPKGVVNLNPGCTLRVIQANEPARKDRYEDGHNPGVGALMTMQIGGLMSPYSTPIGKPNCVELHVPVQGVGNMLGSVMGQSAASLAFGGGMQALKNTRARTYYFSFERLADAEEFAAAVENNVKVLAQANSIGNNTAGAGAGGGGGFGQIDQALNMAYAVQQNQKLITSPDTSLEWFKITLGTSLPADVLYERLMVFYDELAKFNIFSQYG